MEALVATAFGFVLALLVAIVLELRELRRSVDMARHLLSDATGIPLVDPRDVARGDEGTVTIPDSINELYGVERVQPKAPDEESYE